MKRDRERLILEALVAGPRPSLCLVPEARKRIWPDLASTSGRTPPCRPRTRGEHAEQTAPCRQVIPRTTALTGETPGRPFILVAPDSTSTRRPSSPASGGSPPTAASTSRRAPSAP